MDMYTLNQRTKTELAFPEDWPLLMSTAQDPINADDIVKALGSISAELLTKGMKEKLSRMTLRDLTKGRRKYYR